MTRLNERRTGPAFTNCAKASDKVNTNKPQNILGINGFPQHLARAIESMYVETNTVIDNEEQRNKTKL
jgi:hypothetical protein